MCGIAGVMYKDTLGPVGADIKKLTQAVKHRGEDSSGVAIFGPPTGNELDLQISIRISPDQNEQEKTIQVVSSLLTAGQGQVLGFTSQGSIMMVTASYPGPVDQLAYALDSQGVQTISMGNQLVIFKDTGTPEELDEAYGFSPAWGTHAIGHTRLATESCVSPDRAHPFWSYGFKDIATVHNGQITNYWKLRRRFEHLGYQFRTDNDSELIAVYAGHYLTQGLGLRQVLTRSLADLDGTFTFLVATPYELGFAKDKLAAKPLVYADLDDRILLASEEVSLRAALGNELDPVIIEPAPFTIATWSVQKAAPKEQLLYREVV